MKRQHAMGEEPVFEVEKISFEHRHNFKLTAYAIEGAMIMLKVGDKAPDFTVRAHTGEDVSLSDLAGRTVVLWFYPKADTPG